MEPRGGGFIGPRIGCWVQPGGTLLVTTCVELGVSGSEKSTSEDSRKGKLDSRKH